MSAKVLFPDIDFADSRFSSVELGEGKLTIYIESWDAKVITVVFSDPIRFSFKRGDISSDVYEVTEGNFLKTALASEDERLKKGSYKLFQIWDIQDTPYIEVVAKNASAVKEYEKEA